MISDKLKETFERYKRKSWKSRDKITVYSKSSPLIAFDTSTWAQLPTLNVPNGVQLNSISFSPDDTLLAGLIGNRVFFWGIGEDTKNNIIAENILSPM